MMRELYALHDDVLVGTLVQHENGTYSFSYDVDWITNPIAFALSYSLPLQKGNFGHGVTLSFFENLLPEGEIRKDIESVEKIHGTFQFLERHGKDCSGAITLSTTRTSPRSPAKNKLYAIDLHTIYQTLDTKTSVAALFANEKRYLSLAGAQDKFACIYKGGEFFILLDGSPTTHIVKVPIWRHGITESVYNEYFCMSLARKIGLQVPDVSIHPGPHPLYVIERYDRIIDRGGKRIRIHQQDFCQAQGFSSDQKYEDKGGPSIRSNYFLIRDHISPKFRFEAIQQFLSWTCFNLIIGNNDCHSKNISILTELGPKYQIAPFYDLLSTAVYPKLGDEFPFLIGGRRSFSKIGINQIRILEDQLEIRSGTYQDILQKTVTGIQASLPDLYKDSMRKWPDVKVFKKIKDLISKRIKSLALQKAIGSL